MDHYMLGFVVLHYQVIEETIACITSIQEKIDIDHYHIVVVDNKSPNLSGIQLQEKYQDNEFVTILLNDENAGFSKGNNVGFRYAKQLGCDFICMTNNDTQLIQDDFFKQISNEYDESHFAVLGPEIHLVDGSICEYPKQVLKHNEIESDRQRVKKLLFKNKTYLESIHLFLYKYIGKLISWNTIRHKFREVKQPEGRQTNVRLHGCCMIFSPVYIHAFDGLEVRTHFYGEEDVLFVRIIRNHMVSVYQPKVKIFHREEASTSARMRKNIKKRRFIYETHLQTLDMLETMYLEDVESIKEYI